ncbi:MAG: hypothetical protein C0622_07535, partial [Desulfuromonas sp.]
MGRYLISFVALVLLALVGATPLMAAKFKHLNTLYGDGAGKMLKAPEGVACSSTTLVVADSGNERLVRYQITEQGIKGGTVIPLTGRVPLVTQ